MSVPAIVALDLSLTATGWAMHHGTAPGRYLGWNTGVIKPTSTGVTRLLHIRSEVDHLIQQSIDLVPLIVMEGGVARSQAAFGLGELHGVIKAHLWDRHGITPILVPPATLKKYATGSGNTGKPEVLAAAIRRLDYTGHNDNEADALWLLAAALDHYGAPLTTMPAANRAALTKVQWT